MFYKLLEQSINTGEEDVVMFGISYSGAKEILNFDTLCSDKHSVENLMLLCSEGEVTEITLQYVIEDFIACC